MEPPAEQSAEQSADPPAESAGHDEADCLCVVCADYGDADRLDELTGAFARDVERFGWSVLTVPADDGSTGWAFTIGLRHTFAGPEVAIFGLEPAGMVEVLNRIGRQVADGRVLEPFDTVEGLLRHDVPLSLHPVEDAWRPLLFAASLGFYRSTARVPFLQCRWPAPPGDDTQPRLELPSARHPAGPWLPERLTGRSRRRR